MNATSVARILKKNGIRANEHLDVRTQPDVEVGDRRSAKYRISELVKEVHALTADMNVQLPILNAEAVALGKMRDTIIEEGVRRLHLNHTASGAPAARITQADKAFLLRTSPEYFDRLDAHMLASAKLTRAMQRLVVKLRERIASEGTALTVDWEREKIDQLLAHQHEPTISMHFTDLEALITLPSEGKRAKRMIQLEENAINGKPVSAERKNKLTPKPKAKIRAKRAQAAIVGATAAPPPVVTFAHNLKP